MKSSPERLIVLLDSSPLSMIANPKGDQETMDCKEWFKQLIADGHRVVVSAITDYEVRRELMRADKVEGIQNLNALATTAGFLDLSREALYKAAEFWAEARKIHQPGANDIVLDADMILVAQAATLNPRDLDMDGAAIVIATINVRHLKRFADARLWRNIP